MTPYEIRWVRQQPSFDYMVDSTVIFTKCGKRFEDFKEYRNWVNLTELLRYAE